MSESLRIQQGFWKGKKISFPSAVKGNQQFTPSLVKKSLLGRIQSHILDGSIHLDHAVFVDLFAGSGQVGMEAVSLGFRNVWFFELDKKRFSELLGLWKIFSSDLDETFDIRFFHKDGFRFYKDPFDLENRNQWIYFLDPPYSFWNDPSSKLRDCIQGIKNLSSTHCKIIIFIQAPEKANLFFEDKDTKKVEFGNNVLLYWNSLDIK